MKNKYISEYVYQSRLIRNLFMNKHSKILKLLQEFITLKWIFFIKQQTLAYISTCMVHEL